MRVRITEMGKFKWVEGYHRQCPEMKQYIMECEADGKDEIDKKVYRLVVKHNDYIKLGCIIGEPIEAETPMNNHVLEAITKAEFLKKA